MPPGLVRSQAPQPNSAGHRQKAVLLRLAGETLTKVAKETGLSAPTVAALLKAYEAGGWEAIAQRSAGRPKGGSRSSQQ